MKTICFRAMRRSAVLALGLCVAAGGALAAGACTVSSTGLAFGGYQPLTFAGKLTSSDKTSTATVSVVCTAIAAGGSYTLALGAGSYGTGDGISTRYLNNTTNGGAAMVYNIYTTRTTRRYGETGPRLHRYRQHPDWQQQRVASGLRQGARRAIDIEGRQLQRFGDDDDHL